MATAVHLGRSGGCRSRQPRHARLHVEGEHIVDVAPLPVEEAGRAAPAAAVALFTQVAKWLDPTFDLETHREDVVTICRSVDGVPLALELAAGHIRTLPPSLLRSRLGARLGSPAGAARDLPARQATVPATIDWSLQLLGPPERRLFARLGVFTAPVSLDAVESVCADGTHDVLDGFSRLVDQSLVRRVVGARGQPRFGQLALLRERARQLLSGPDRVEVERRHAHYLADRLEDIGALLVGASDAALRTLEVARQPADLCEHERVTAGLRAALGQARYAELLSEGAQLSLDEAVQLALSDEEAPTHAEPGRP